MDHNDYQKIKDFLENNAGTADYQKYETAQFAAEQRNKYTFLSAHPEISKDFDLSLLIVKAYPELTKNLNAELLGNGRFMLEAFYRKNSTYQHASDEIKAYCGSAPFDGMGSMEALYRSAGYPTPDQVYAEIGSKLKAFAVAQEERKALEQSLSNVARPQEPKTRRTHKI